MPETLPELTAEPPAAPVRERTGLRSLWKWTPSGWRPPASEAEPDRSAAPTPTDLAVEAVKDLGGRLADVADRVEPLTTSPDTGLGVPEVLAEAGPLAAPEAPPLSSQPFAAPRRSTISRFRTLGWRRRRLGKDASRAGASPESATGALTAPPDVPGLVEQAIEGDASAPAARAESVVSPPGAAAATDTATDTATPSAQIEVLNPVELSPDVDASASLPGELSALERPSPGPDRASVVVEAGPVAESPVEPPQSAGTVEGPAGRRRLERLRPWGIPGRARDGRAPVAPPSVPVEPAAYLADPESISQPAPEAAPVSAAAVAAETVGVARESSDDLDLLLAATFYAGAPEAPILVVPFEPPVGLGQTEAAPAPSEGRPAADPSAFAAAAATQAQAPTTVEPPPDAAVDVDAQPDLIEPSAWLDLLVAPEARALVEPTQAPVAAPPAIWMYDASVVLAMDRVFGEEWVSPFAPERYDGVARPVSTQRARRVSPRRRTRMRRLRRVAASAACLVLVAAAFAYPQRERYTDDAAELSRAVIGEENTARVEGWYFQFQDRVDKLKFKFFGGDTNPFGSEAFVEFVPKPPSRTYLVDRSPKARELGLLLPEAAVSFKPKPFELPATTQLQDKPETGEGIWAAAGLPRTTPDDFLMARTFIRPDKSRPYAVVGVLALDVRRIKLVAVPGTEHPGGDRGVKGAGIIPASEYKSLVAAFNGGFQGPHGGYGMWAEGREFRPLRNGLASIAVLSDGTIQLGEWGRTLSWDDKMVAVRQNAVLLVENCEVSPRTKEGNDTWGYVEVNSADFITWRSAVGLTKEGNLLIADGNSLSAETLARALWAAGACTAMQLDINTPYVLTSTFFPQPDGTVEARKFLNSMTDSPSRFFKTQTRDFFYVVQDETRYR